ncbi:MAG: DUF1924 domain-containing protein [Mariprofundus sp.]|nr:DUF1924 domain-containing protein [Mariprofundus sp.]
MFRICTFALFLMLNAPLVMAADVIDEMLTSYQAEGVSHFDADEGDKLWHQQFPAPVDAESSKARSCQTCHGADLKKPGEHIRTGKVIKPMSLTVSADRYSDVKKINKWFRRNCNWVMGRECTNQEKGNLLIYLRQQ